MVSATRSRFQLPGRRVAATLALAACSLFSLAAASCPAQAQTGPKAGKSSSSSSSAADFAQEKAPSLVDPAGPAISLVDSETLFTMAAALNACGYDEGLAESDPIRMRIREEVARALAGSEAARAARDKVCLYIAQHRMTGSVKDIAQYISLALYLTPPPEMELSVELPEMPPDSTQVAEIVPLLNAFATALDLHGIWLTQRHSYDEAINSLHEPLTQMILATNYYLKIPAATYDGRRFLVVVEPQLSPRTVNARVYGADYILVLSPVHSQIAMADVRHTYLHYLIEPLLYQHATSMDRLLPILKYVKDAPSDYQYRSDIVSLTIESLIKAIEARTMDTGVPVYQPPVNADRSLFPQIEHDRSVYQQKVDAVRWARVRHEMAQGFVLTQYFYEALIQFEKDPAGLKDVIGELVYGMDIEQQMHRAKEQEFDTVADGDVLRRSAPRKLTGLDLAEARLAAGDFATAISLARQTLAGSNLADYPRANFILARAAILTGHPDDAMDGFLKVIASQHRQLDEESQAGGSSPSGSGTSGSGASVANSLLTNTRIFAWSHIYLGRMLDLDCKRDQAVAEYKQALAVRDGQQDTRLAAERGLKTAYAANGHSCDADSGDATGPDAPGATSPAGASPERKNPDLQNLGPDNPGKDSPFVPAGGNSPKG